MDVKSVSILVLVKSALGAPIDTALSMRETAVSILVLVKSALGALGVLGAPCPDVDVSILVLVKSALGERDFRGGVSDLNLSSQFLFW